MGMLEFPRWNFVRGILNKESRENIPNGTLYILSIDANDRDWMTATE